MSDPTNIYEVKFTGLKTGHTSTIFMSATPKQAGDVKEFLDTYPAMLTYTVKPVRATPAQQVITALGIVLLNEPRNGGSE